MRNYADMDLETVLKVTSNLIVDHMADQGVDVHYPDQYVLGILMTLENAESLAAKNNIVGFGIGAKFISGIAEALHVKIPEALSDRLHARVNRA